MATNNVFFPKLKYVKERYKCLKCGRLLRDPVQTSCGHRMCKTCAENLMKDNAKCPGEESCDVVLKENLHKDRCVEKKMNKMCNEEVDCSFQENGCRDIVLFKDIEDHEMKCEFRGPVTAENDFFVQDHEMKREFIGPVTAENDSSVQNHEMKREFIGPVTAENDSSVQDHEMKCEFRGPVTAENDCSVQRYEEEKQDFQDITQLSDKMQKQKALLEEDKQNLHEIEGDFDDAKKEASELCNDLRMTVDFCERLEAKIAEFSENTFENYRDISQLRQENAELINALLQRYRNAATVQLSEATGIPVRNHADRDEQILARAEVDKQSDRIETGLAQNDYRRVTPISPSGLNAADVEHVVDHQGKQLDLLEMNYQKVKIRSSTANIVKDGYLILKVKDFTNKKSDVRRKCFYSEPFYTSDLGYCKVQGSIYLNGDGMGYQSHLSLYLEKIEGEFDALFLLPFHCRITLGVLNPTNPQNDVSKSLVVDMIPGEKYGFPQFMELNVLENTDQGYIVDDTLFIKLVVEQITN